MFKNNYSTGIPYWWWLLSCTRSWGSLRLWPRPNRQINRQYKNSSDTTKVKSPFLLGYRQSHIQIRENNFKQAFFYVINLIHNVWFEFQERLWELICINPHAHDDLQLYYIIQLFLPRRHRAIDKKRKALCCLVSNKHYIWKHNYSITYTRFFFYN